MMAIEDALWENGGELTEELQQALAETEQSIASKVDGYNHIIASFDAKAEIIDKEIKRLTLLKKTAENASKRIKQHVCDTMGMFGIEKLEGAYCKMTRAKSTKTEVNEEQITAAFINGLQTLNESLPSYITADFKINKTALKDYIKEEGITPAGVEFVENWSLRIR
jgi:hypothetical protein